MVHYHPFIHPFIHSFICIANAAGNKRFREAITKSLDDYRKACTRTDKAAIVQRVIDEIANSGGRFLKKNQATGEWYQLNEQQTKEKVSHAVRDAANTMDAKKTQGKAKINSAKDKPDDRRLSLGVASMPSFSSHGSLIGSSANFYDNLDRATREIRRHASQQNTAWPGAEPSYHEHADLGRMGHAAGERVPVPAVHDEPMPGVYHRLLQQQPLSVPQHAHIGSMQQGMHGSPGVEHDGRIHTNSLSEPCIGGQILHGVGCSGAIMMPEGPRVGFANVMQPNQPSSMGNRGLLQLPPSPMMPPPQQMIQQQYSSDEGDHFLERINDVLGPLPSDADDPMGTYLGRRDHPRRW